MAYRIAAMVLGSILLAYWGRVVRLVYKFRKRAGHDANFRPRERLGMLLRVVWYPAVLCWIALPLVVGAMGEAPDLHSLLRPLYVNLIVAYVALFIAAAAFAATLVCWKRMGKSWRMGINPDEKTQLIVSGPYAYVRHPIYALSSVLMLCSMAAIPAPLMLVVGMIHLSLLQWEAWREEKYLLVHHGEAYGHYCRYVGRFLPYSTHPYAPLGIESSRNSQAAPRAT